jgi:GTP pyrophosphokinase
MYSLPYHIYEVLQLSAPVYYSLSIVPPKDVRIIERMYRYSKYGHRNQVRDNDVRYFDHPKECAIIAMREFKISDWRTITVLLGHDLQEDSFLADSEDLEINFGTDVARDIRVLSKIPKEGYLERLRLFGSSTAWIAKLCDRLHNLRTLSGCTPEKQVKQIKETKDHYLWFADHLPTKVGIEQAWLGSAFKDKILEACDYYS